MSNYIPLILFTVLTNFASQVMLKKGMSMIEKFEVSIPGFMASATGIIFNWYIVLGLVVMVVSMSSHLVVLSRVEISYAYPFLGLSFVLITLWGFFILEEGIDLWRILGVALICSGVAIVAHT